MYYLKDHIYTNEKFVKLLWQFVKNKDKIAEELNFNHFQQIIWIVTQKTRANYRDLIKKLLPWWIIDLNEDENSSNNYSSYFGWMISWIVEICNILDDYGLIKKVSDKKYESSIEFLLFLTKKTTESVYDSFRKNHKVIYNIVTAKDTSLRSYLSKKWITSNHLISLSSERLQSINYPNMKINDEILSKNKFVSSIISKIPYTENMIIYDIDMKQIDPRFDIKKYKENILEYGWNISNDLDELYMLWLILVEKNAIIIDDILCSYIFHKQPKDLFGKLQIQKQNIESIKLEKFDFDIKKYELKKQLNKIQNEEIQKFVKYMQIFGLTEKFKKKEIDWLAKSMNIDWDLCDFWLKVCKKQELIKLVKEKWEYVYRFASTKSKSWLTKLLELDMTIPKNFLGKGNRNLWRSSNLQYEMNNIKHNFDIITNEIASFLADVWDGFVNRDEFVTELTKRCPNFKNSINKIKKAIDNYSGWYSLSYYGSYRADYEVYTDEVLDGFLFVLEDYGLISTASKEISDRNCIEYLYIHSDSLDLWNRIKNIDKQDTKKNIWLDGVIVQPNNDILVPMDTSDDVLSFLKSIANITTFDSIMTFRPSKEIIINSINEKKLEISQIRSFFEKWTNGKIPSLIKNTIEELEDKKDEMLFCGNGNVYFLKDKFVFAKFLKNKEFENNLIYKSEQKMVFVSSLSPEKMQKIATKLGVMMWELQLEAKIYDKSHSFETVKKRRPELMDKLKKKDIDILSNKDKIISWKLIWYNATEIRIYPIKKTIIDKKNNEICEYGDRKTLKKKDISWLRKKI